MLEEEIISSVLQGVAEGVAASSGGSGDNNGSKGERTKNSSQKQRRFSYPAMFLIIAGVVCVGAFTIAELLEGIESFAPYRVYLVWAQSLALPIIGALMIGSGISFEVWDSRRIWHRPKWRIRNELTSALKTMHLTTVSTIDSAAAPLEGLIIDRYKWDQRSYCASVRVVHPGNARINLESLERMVKANPFRYAHSAEVEQFYTRRKTPDGYTIRIYYRNDSETIDRQLKGGRPWMMK